MESGHRSTWPCRAAWLARALCLAGAALSDGPALAQGRVTVCTDPDPPPSAYWERDPRGVRNGRITGFSVELAREALRGIGREAEVIGKYPWSRCLRLVLEGRIDFALGAYHDEERARRLAYSTALSRTTPQVYFAASRPLQIHDKADLRRHRGCGLRGASYAQYGLERGDLDQGVTTFAKLIEKVRAGRCAYFVEEHETFEGYRLAGNDLLGRSGLVHAPVPGAREPTTHIVASHQAPAARLMPALDRELRMLIASGRAAQLWRQHAGESMPYRSP